MSRTSDPSCAVCERLLGPSRAEPLFENELWHVRHIEPPHAVAGWMLLVLRRHAAGPAFFDDREAASLGPTLRRLQQALLEVTGALRIYTAALGESSPHFHCHMVPRYAAMPKDAKAWAVFDLQRAAAQGEVSVEPAEVERVSSAYAKALAAEPPVF